MYKIEDMLAYYSQEQMQNEMQEIPENNLFVEISNTGKSLKQILVNRYEELKIPFPASGWAASIVDDLKLLQVCITSFFIILSTIALLEI